MVDVEGSCPAARSSRGGLYREATVFAGTSSRANAFGQTVASGQFDLLPRRVAWLLILFVLGLIVY